MTYHEIIQIYKYIEPEIPFRPAVGVVLGSGLGEYIASIKKEKVIPYSNIPGFPISSVHGHRGQYVFAYIGGVPTVLMDGRVHYYEGYSAEKTVLPIRVMRLMGIDSLILTNAAGAISTALKVGQYMAITDHIIYNVPSPLIGPNLNELGARFPDMTKVYDAKYTDILVSAAKRAGARMGTGVYIQVSGPQFETPAEIKAYAQLGADAVGMSTAIEACAARHAGVRVCGLSIITNMAAGISKTAISNEEINEKSAQIMRTTIALLNQAVVDIAAHG